MSPGNGLEKLQKVMERCFRPFFFPLLKPIIFLKLLFRLAIKLKRSLIFFNTSIKENPNET